MKKKAKFFNDIAFYILSLAFFGAVFVSCGESVEPPEVAATPPLKSGEKTEPKKANEAVVYGKLSAEKPASSSRTAMPDASSFPSITSYTVTAVKSDGTVVNAAIDNSKESPTFSLTLSYGNWDVTGRAITSFGPDLSQTKSITLDENNPIASLNFNFSYMEEGTGNISLSISFPTEFVKSATYKLKNPKTNVSFENSASDYEISQGAFSVYNSNVSTGLWNLTVYLYDENGAIIQRIDQAVNVYKGITTNNFKSDNSYYSISGGSLVVSRREIEDFANSTFFVGGTGPTGKSASDQNNGTQFDPVATLGRAIELASISKTSKPTITIYIMGNTDESNDITINSAKSIRILNSDSETPLKINGSGKNLNVIGNHLIIENLIFDNFDSIDIHSSATFELSGKTQFTNGTVNLKESFITIESALTPPDPTKPVAKINAETSGSLNGLKVLQAGEGVSITEELCEKFEILNQGYKLFPSRDGKEGVILIEILSENLREYLSSAEGQVSVTVRVDNEYDIYTIRMILAYSNIPATGVDLKISGEITSLDIQAFEDCSKLTSVEIPNSVTSIGDEAFSRCSSLTSVEIPDSVTSIGYSAFYGCSSLTKIDVETGNPNYSSLDGVLFNNDKTSLVCWPCGKDYTSSLIPNSVTSIGEEAFYGCSSLTSVEIPNSVTSIGNRAFSNCSSLTSVEIPNSVTSIGDSAFDRCSSLTSVEIPNSVISIGNYAFYGCSSLTSIEIPSSVTSIGDAAFSRCSSLTSIDVAIGNPNYSSLDGVLFNNDKTSLEVCPKVKTGTYSIPNSVTSIGNHAFDSCSSLTSVEIPNSVTSIGNSAFCYCSSLTSVEIPDSVTSIGSIAFYYCSKLTSVEIPDSVTSIGASTFAGCSSLTSVKIPDSVTSIGYSAFNRCSSLTSVEIPNSVTSIDSNAFHTCSSLTSVEIPDSVTSIGSGVFYNCSSLTSVEIPNSVTSIGDAAFAGCSSLTSITFNDTENWYANTYSTPDFSDTYKIDVTNPQTNATNMKKYSGA